MKLINEPSPRTEMKIFAGIFSVTGLSLLATLVWTVPAYHTFRKLGWQTLFRQESFYEQFMTMYAFISFGIMPTTAILLGLAAFVLLKYAHHAPHPVPVAS